MEMDPRAELQTAQAARLRVKEFANLGVGE